MKSYVTAAISLVLPAFRQRQRIVGSRHQTNGQRLINAVVVSPPPPPPPSSQCTIMGLKSILYTNGNALETKLSGIAGSQARAAGLSARACCEFQATAFLETCLHTFRVEPLLPILAADRPKPCFFNWTIIMC